MGIFDSLFSAFSSKPAENAAQAQIAGLNAARGAATTDINRGLDQSNQFLTRAYDLYSPLVASAGQGATSYGNALGLGGQGGLDSARQTFTSLPGYQEGLNTGLDTLERRAGARGMLGSGNTSADTIKFASDYANQKYGDYLSGLQPYLGLQGQYTGAQAGALGQQSANAIDVSKLLGGIGFQTEQGIGNANAQSAMAPYQSSQNFLSTLLGLGQVGASAFGGKPK